MKTVSEYIGREPFHPEIPETARRLFKDLVNESFKLHDATVIMDFETEYGTSPLAIMLLEDGKGDKFTTASFNTVVVNQVSKMLGKEDFPPEEPLHVTIKKTDRYYHLV